MKKIIIDVGPDGRSEELSMEGFKGVGCLAEQKAFLRQGAQEVVHRPTDEMNQSGGAGAAALIR